MSIRFAMYKMALRIIDSAALTSALRYALILRRTGRTPRPPWAAAWRYAWCETMAFRHAARERWHGKRRAVWMQRCREAASALAALGEA